MKDTSSSRKQSHTTNIISISTRTDSSKAIGIPFYRGAIEPIPGDTPELRGNVMFTHYFANADHSFHLQTHIQIDMSNDFVVVTSSDKKRFKFVIMWFAVELIESLLRNYGALYTLGILPCRNYYHLLRQRSSFTKNAVYSQFTVKTKHNRSFIMGLERGSCGGYYYIRFLPRKSEIRI